jgi:hypothetical protein
MNEKFPYGYDLNAYIDMKSTFSRWLKAIIPYENW